MFVKFLIRPLKLVVEVFAATLVLYMTFCTLIQSYQFYQGGRTAWMALTNYQQKIEQIQTLNPFD